MNQLKTDKRAQIIRTLCEGNSLRATARLNGVAINTVIKLLLEVGPACAGYQDDHLRNLNSMVVQVDEIWSFVGKKAKNASAEDRAEGLGDCWTWTALDADSKLLITWHIGLRQPDDCQSFMYDLAERLTKRIQLSSDGFGTYPNAVRMAFGQNVDFGQIVKVFGSGEEAVARYSPAVCTSCTSKAVIGDPLESQISTSYVERQNLNIRMGNRRFTRLTNAFSKKLENHMAAFSLYAMHFNYCRPHQTLTKEAKVKTTPAMASGLTDHVWTVDEMIASVLADSK